MPTKTVVENDVEIIMPKLYKVMLLNDDYTTFDFVIEILKTVFHKNEEEAINITLKVDREGSAAVGVYPYEIAQVKIEKTHTLARQAGYPLRAVMEEV
ncbi:ATP-dependent Clp protease adaptor protein ClpS [Nautilia profundicola AmH]|uniref:ATP-dependent Clp protease adapter protein ClpS n=1 Tax=Nautilia profundicola (strain ATCC BAA-1463 / DSM 18972 / AmH) TaxID=598659 RepID=CLPS_NAUPA|nr:ATP-dependent Clp protease adaptor ClpS [Nautilia profundicola]B9L8R5.1 RecName: Full=ATP-dependent Clp protease adapter protein ClpS [Nautilia profundicola AmH]ACM92912.1 ATP-dependent Clp protease adaptor protein ClpS [Nautilia profundicola AmH]